MLQMHVLPALRLHVYVHVHVHVHVLVEGTIARIHAMITCGLSITVEVHPVLSPLHPYMDVSMSSSFAS